MRVFACERITRAPQQALAQPNVPGIRHYAFLVVPGYGLFVIRLTGLLTLKREGYEKQKVALAA
jgi:hypothetical protein